MKGFRLNRMFSALSRRCCAVAIENGLLAGIANPDRCVRLLVEAAPDAIELTVGHAELLQSIPGKSKPALVLRADVSNVHGRELPPALFSRVIGNAVEQAVRLDAACVVANLFHIPGQPGITDQCLANIQRLAPDCARFAMPLMIELLVLRTDMQDGGFVADGDLENILPLVRHAGLLERQHRINPRPDPPLAHPFGGSQQFVARAHDRAHDRRLPHVENAQVEPHLRP